MAKLVKCKTCGEEIAKSAKICPKCGAKQKKSHPVLAVLLLILMIGGLGAAVGEKDTPKKVEDADTQPTVGAEEQVQQTEFFVGDTVSLNDIEVTFVSCTKSTGQQFFKPEDGNVFLTCEFLIDNKSSRDIAISSILCFEAYVDDFSTAMSFTGTSLSDKPQLDGTVAAGRKMSGVIAYEVPKNWEKLEVRFTPDFWSNRDITFIAEN